MLGPTFEWCTQHNEVCVENEDESAEDKEIVEFHVIENLRNERCDGVYMKCTST